MEQRRAEFKNAKMLSVSPLFPLSSIDLSQDCRCTVDMAALTHNVMCAALTGLAKGAREDESGAGHRASR